MRLSTQKNDPGYNIQRALHCKIFVDGEDVTSNCHTADEEKGMAWCYDLDEDGDRYTDPDTGCVAEIVLDGKVEIRILQNGTSV